MRTRRRDRIGLAEVNQLVAGEPVAPAHRGVSALLAAAAAAPFPEELADERAAVAGFARMRREAVPAPAKSGRWRAVTLAGPRRERVPLSRAVMLRVAAATAIAMTGGTALAAATGSLPDGVQRQAHQLLAPLGVPAPSTHARPSAPGRRPSPSASADAGAGPVRSAPAGAGTTGGPDDPQAPGLCHAWEAAQNNPHGKPMPPQPRRALAAAAGGERNIPAFCAAVLGGQRGQSVSSATPSPGPPTPAAGSTHSGDGGDKGGGHSSGHPGKTHGPHSNG